MSAVVRVSINEPNYLRLTGPGGDVARFRARVANRVLNNSRQRVNVDTGNLRSTGSVSEAGPDTTQVAYRARYALFVHNGWQHHQRDHASYRGNPYLTDALREEMSRL